MMLMRNAVLAGLLLSTAAMAQPATAPLDPRARAERDLLERAVEIPTVAGRREMPRLTALLAAEFRGAGITDIQIKPHGDTETMIVRWPAARPSGQRPILLMAHMDVVEARRADWTHDPFEFREADGYYWGRGISDNKAGMVAIVSALKRLRTANFQTGRDIIVLFTGDEESGQEGARLASTEWRPLIDAEYALNSDGGGGALFRDGRARGWSFQTGEKIYADYRFVATNRGGHSSAPRGDNAIYQLANALSALEDYRFRPMLNETTRASFAAQAEQDGGAWGVMIGSWLDQPDDAERADAVEDFAPGSTRTRCVATQLNGGHAPNALPQRAEANVNCRIFPGTDLAAHLRELQAIAGQNVRVEVVDAPMASPASPIRADIVAAFRAALATKYPDPPVIPVQINGATDGAFLRSAGIPTYGVSPLWSYLGDQSGVHGLNERIVSRAFHEQIDIWETMLRTLAGPAAR